jgi:pantothenate kinase
MEYGVLSQRQQNLTITATYNGLGDSKRMLLAIAGIPGSGKTTLASLVATRLNQRHKVAFPWLKSEVATVIPLDGYHHPRSYLDTLSNAKEAHYRRGAAFTFDGEAYLALVRQLAEPWTQETPTVHAPSFSHADKDPIANAIPIKATSRIIIFEGLYCALSRPPWSEAAALMTELWFMDVPLPIAEARVAKRNFAAGLSPSLEAAVSRTKDSDMRNAQDVLENRVQNIVEVVQSVEDAEWKGQEVEALEKELEEERRKEREMAEKAGGTNGRPGVLEERGRMDSIAELTANGAGW